jgi:hypothetical protein
LLCELNRHLKYSKCLKIEICTRYERDMHGQCTRNERHVRVMNYHVLVMNEVCTDNVRTMNDMYVL